ncbi:MAG: aminotransferase class I/II-fold pyridoxal phosphate-dependent enzyme, partial [archaeon]
MNHGKTHYAPSGGILEMKVAAADVTSRSRGFKPDLDQLLVTPGANAQLFYAMACSANPGEEVIMPDPSFVSYNAIASFLGLKAVKVPLREENEFRLNPEDVRRAVTDKTRMIIINSPSNPTGSVMTPTENEEIFNIAREANAYLLSDEIYARMI